MAYGQSMALDSVWRPDESVTRRAVETAREVLRDPRTLANLSRYYTSNNDYAGATFLDLEPNLRNEISATDLLAVSTLSVSIHPGAIRTFLQERQALTELLKKLDPHLELKDADPLVTAVPMAEFYEAVKACLRRSGARTSNAWVTASKICARKRPYLFPVRDNVVLDLLELPKTYPVDWPAFQALSADEEATAIITAHIHDLRGNSGVDVGDKTHLLRHMDVALWMHAIGRSSGQASAGPSGLESARIDQSESGE